jgi:ribonuclease III
VTALAEDDGLRRWIRQVLGHEFKDESLYLTALTHRSASSAHNERLEFLGDAVLNCAVAQMLYEAHTGVDEGALSRLRASLVSGETLAQIAAGHQLGDYLRLGSGELKSGGFRRASILADALEALIGAVMVDAGFDAAAAVVRRLVGPRMRDLPPAESLKDAKTRLQELLQSQGLPLPAYNLASVQGESHSQVFAVTCEVGSMNLITSGEGSSRRRAEQLAAERMLAAMPASLKNRA